MRISRALLIVGWALWATGYAGDQFGFDTQQGFIPNDSPGCRVEVDLPEPLEDGLIIELDESATTECGNTSQWRVTEYDEGKFFAAALIPLPNALILNYGQEHPFKYNRLKDVMECVTVESQAAPIDYAHEVLKTENCQRVLYDGYAEEVIFRGIPTGVIESYFVNRRVVSEFKRWLVRVESNQSVVGFYLGIIESFAPEHGNARWHVQRYDDLNENSCPPGDWRDVKPLQQEAFDTYSMEEAHRRAAYLDYLGRVPTIIGGMTITPTNGASRYHGNHKGMDYAQADQVHGVIRGGPLGCIAMAWMMLPDDLGDVHVGAFRRRMQEEDKINVIYSPVWHRAYVWYRREETNGIAPETPNFVYQTTRGIAYREPDEPTDSVNAPAICTAAPSQ